MKQSSVNGLKIPIFKFLLLCMLGSGIASADCQYQLFNITAAQNVKVKDFIDQLSNDCQFSIVVTDKYAKRILNSDVGQTYIKNLTLGEVFKLILSNNNLFYTFKDNTLTISYLKTKTFDIDYILSQRTANGSTDITIGSTSNGTSGGLMNNSSSSSSNSNSNTGNQATSGVTIKSEDKMQFWHKLDQQLKEVLNRPEDTYVAEDPIINKNAGLITVTATKNQLSRLNEYLKRLQQKVKLQVLIDVQLLTVTMDKSKTTGIDWSELYKLGDVNVNLGYGTSMASGLVSGGSTSSTGTTSTPATTSGSSSYVTITGVQSLSNIIKFLKTQGKVHSISNPKVLTLNNQPALITSGTQYFYTLTQSENQTSSGGTSTATNQIIQSVFAGILLDITPEISDNNMITLKINPSISSTVENMSSSTSATRSSPPDLDRSQLSSVVTVKNGSRIILGGLIQTITTVDNNKVPILGDIPGLSYLFSHKSDSKQVKELVIVIQPHIIRHGKSKLTLSDLGYENIGQTLLQRHEDTNSSKQVKLTTNAK
jgi:general secretion pathway protein D